MQKNMLGWVIDSGTHQHRAFPFLAAFNEIEEFLRRALDAHHHTSFSTMVRQAERDEIITADQADDLLELADLRNAISHGRYGRQNQPIAEPNPDTLRTITKIRNELLQPVSALQLVRAGRVTIYRPHTTIGELVTASHGKYPVYSEGKFVALLTDGDIVAWLAAQRPQTGRQMTIDLRTPISSLLSEVGAATQCVFVAKNAPPQVVIHAMTTPVAGHLPRAVIITESGRPHQKPLRIITGTELALLIEKRS